MGMDNKQEKDYARLIAAQNESERRLKIRSICNTVNKEYQMKNRMALMSGICIVGVAASVRFSGIDVNEALAIEMKILNSFDSVKEYFSLFTPATWATAALSGMSIVSSIKHNKKYKDALEELKGYEEIRPENYLDVVEKQAKNK